MQINSLHSNLIIIIIFVYRSPLLRLYSFLYPKDKVNVSKCTLKNL